MMFLHFLPQTIREYNLLAAEEVNPAQSCWPHTFTDRFSSDEVKRESVISEQPLQIIYNYCDCSHSTHSRC